MPNALYYGDNLEILRKHIPDESVDLVYLDPPFNSQANYNVLFRAPTGEQSQAQIEAFEDTWHWNATALVPERERFAGLSHDDGRSPPRASPDAQSSGEPVSALRSYSQPLS
jgi:site-specific DNA-methyltransferase (adenine-specific)